MSKKKTPPPAQQHQNRLERPEETPQLEPAASSAGFQFEPAWLWATVLTVLTVAVYFVSLDNGFMVFDDDKAIRYNNLIKNPSFKGLFMANNLGMYAPITWCGYALVYALAGESASAFHTFSLLLHIGCVLSVFTLMRMLQSRSEVAFFTALLFALHPMQVEATSWIAGQSALTFSLFYLLSLMAYVKWQQSERGLFYGLSILAFLLSVLSKSAAVTLPVLLLALDWYKNGSVTFKNVLSKAPYFVVSLIFGLYTFSTREAEGHDLVVSSSAYNLFDRFLMVCHSLLFYPVQLLAPFKLSVLYPMQKIDGVWPIDYYLAPVALAGVAWAAWKFGRRDKVIGLSALW